MVWFGKALLKGLLNRIYTNKISPSFAQVAVMSVMQHETSVKFI